MNATVPLPRHKILDTTGNIGGILSQEVSFHRVRFSSEKRTRESQWVVKYNVRRKHYGVGKEGKTPLERFCELYGCPEVVEFPVLLLDDLATRYVLTYLPWPEEGGWVHMCWQSTRADLRTRVRTGVKRRWGSSGEKLYTFPSEQETTKKEDPHEEVYTPEVVHASSFSGSSLCRTSNGNRACFPERPVTPDLFHGSQDERRF